MDKTPRIRIPPEVRRYVMERDRHQCSHCGAGPAQAELTVDHIIPLAQGGTNDLSNLQVLCRRCNSTKRHGFDTKRDRQFRG
jgi:5-methylcytosine-specific restriction protein A